jgi:pyridoxine 5-phosphate synthase
MVTSALTIDATEVLVDLSQRQAFHHVPIRERNIQIERLAAAARHANGLGIRVNAGHGLNLQNLPLLHLVPHLVELNIGHSIVSRAVFVGLQPAIREFLAAMQGYPG